MVDVEAAYRRYFPLIREKCRRMLSDPAEADDVAQETFVRLWNARLPDGDPRRLIAWIYRTSTRIAIDRLRRRAARMSMDEGLDRLAIIPTGPDEALAVRRALELVSRSLPATEVEIAVLLAASCAVTKLDDAARRGTSRRFAPSRSRHASLGHAAARPRRESGVHCASRLLAALPAPARRQRWAWYRPRTRARPDSQRPRSGMTRLEEFAPTYQFNEVHRIRIRAPRSRIYRSIKEVTAAEITLFRALTWIRRFGKAGPESILNAPGHEPVLEVATRTGFLLLADDLERELVVGTVVIAPAGMKRPATPEQFKELDAPGVAKAVMNFRIDDAGDGACLLSTETRVHATDAQARRRFAGYWTVIRPGSGFIRRMWLRAIKRRAESRRE